MVSLISGQLIISQPGRFSDYPWTLLPLTEEPDAFRLLMREPSPSTKACTSSDWPGAQLCHTSCFREMARGDIGLLKFERNATSGHVIAFASGLFSCRKFA